MSAHTNHQPAAAPAPRISSLEDRFEHFTDDVIHAHAGAAPLMRDMNRMFTICAGLGAVLRIVAGSVVAQDTFDPKDSDSARPLSQATISSLTSMAAAVCEQMADDVVVRADWYKTGAPA